MRTACCLLAILVLALAAPGCRKETPAEDNGKKRFTTMVDGDTREYYVHVPSGYDGSTPLPLVFMLHGTSGDGLKMYNVSGWKEVGEKENFISVFPSSWEYCLFDHQGDKKTTTKWNSLPADWYLCQGQVARDDIKFLRRVLEEMQQRYKIQANKVYLVGFSNGGQMAAKCAIEMSDVFAAVVHNASGFSFDTTYTPLRRIPTTYQLGNKDWGPGNTGPEISLTRIDEAVRDTSYRAAVSVNASVKSFGLSPNYTLSGDTSYAAIATFASLDGDPGIYHRFVFVKGLGHVYPNGSNHPMKGAEEHWAWMKQF